MPDQLVYANGVNGFTGDYLLEPSTAKDLAATIVDLGSDAERDTLLAATQRDGAHLGLPWNVDPTDLRAAGWCVVFGSEESDGVKQALEPLIEHRRSALGADKVKVLDYLPGESFREWLIRQGTGVGNINVDKVPYYVLLAGNPESIPFVFQYLLDVEYAVGRVDFDEPDGYGRYAASVIAWESDQAVPRSRNVAFFGTKHPGDPPTQMSAANLVIPLANGNDSGPGVPDALGFGEQSFVEQDATKANLAEILSGEGRADRPALLFSATHGIGGWPANHADQPAKHGALLCQDWPGVGSMNSSNYYSADDLDDQADVHGLVGFLFACYGAGTPKYDEFVLGGGQAPPVIADRPFTAALPKAMLSHPGGGALAVIGHIERAWGYSFWNDDTPLLQPFQNAMALMLQGNPVGFAMNDFNAKYATLSTSLSSVLREISFGKVVEDAELATLWTERNDAQNYVLLGDPAVRLNV